MRWSHRLQLLLGVTSSVQAGVISSRRPNNYVSSPVKVCTGTSPNTIASPNKLGSGITPVTPVKHNPDWWYELSPGDVPSGQGNLPQDATNGQSPLGTVDAPQYPSYIGSQGPADNPQDCPWGDKTAHATDPYHDPPDTGVVRRYQFNIQRQTLAPDGVPLSLILVNGQFPGPTIEANWGDWFEIEVTNNIQSPAEGTSLHWHGILQKEMPWEDGVPGISQCPIAPGETFTYRFKADLYGTSWWHAHYSAQYVAGIYGAMIIHGPTDNAQYDIDLGPVLITDYFHDTYYDMVTRVMGTSIPSVLVFSDNNLINGKGVFNCSFAPDPQSCDPNAGLAKFHFQKGKSHRLRLINAGAEGLQKFSIDGHKLTVIAYDFVPIVPHETEIVTLAVGQRADVVVTANGDDDGIYWMRSTMSAACSLTKQPNALAMIYYDNADINAKPNSTAWQDNTDPCANDDLSTAVPFHAMTPIEPDMEIEIDITFGQNETGHYLWYVNNSTFRADFNTPVLPTIMDGVAKQGGDWPKEWNVYDVGASKSVRITLNNKTPVVHPMHIHGHNMYVLSATHPPTPPPASTNTTTNTTVSTRSLRQHSQSSRRQASAPLFVNAQNPTRRDTQILPPLGQIVIQFDGDNPGVWPLHCHIAWHVSGGLYMNIVENMDAMQSMTTTGIGGNWKENNDGLCQKWQTWTDSLNSQGQVVDVIDSGLRMLEKER